MDKIKVGIVNYLNTKPLLYGIEHSPVIDSIELIQDHPANIAAALIKGNIDLGLIPVAVIPQMQEHYIISDYCIGCNGAVASVCLFSDVPVEQIEKIYLDPQSRTSVELLKILLKEYWNVNPQLISSAETNHLPYIKETTGGLVIGDRSFEQRLVSKYIYDLGEGWKQLTGLPFVFAAWVSNKPLTETFIQLFNEANKHGLENIQKVIAETSFTLYDLTEYFISNMSYELDAQKKTGMDQFLNKLRGS